MRTKIFQVAATMAALASGCGQKPSTAARAASAECTQWADSLAAIAVRAGDFAAMPDSAELYVRAGRLWQLQHQRGIEAIVVRDEQSMLANPDDSVARDPKRAAALRGMLAQHRARVAELDAAIVAAKASADAAGFPELGDDDGASRALQAGYWREAARQAATLQTSCRAAPATIAPGRVAALVLDANAAAHELGGNGHDIASYQVAQRYAALPLAVRQ